MKIVPITPQITEYLKKHNLLKKFDKQLLLLQANLRHPSLHTELLEPKERNLRSFRIDRNYRAIFFYDPAIQIIKILAITNHYQ